MKKIIVQLVLFSLAAFFNSCLVQKKMVQTDLYFGLSQSNGRILSDSAWKVFLQNDVSHVFTQGFTIIHVEGKWFDTINKQLYSEPSRIISSVNKMTAKTSANIDSLRERYKVLFQQQSVLRVDKKSSISF